MFRSIALSLFIAALTAQTVAAGSSQSPTAAPYDHNGSRVSIDARHDMIIYDEPKPSLADVTVPGSTLFLGHIHYPGTPESDKTTHGTAYAFKKGCSPAGYPVTGTWSADRSTLTLRGRGPVRSGCAVTSYSLSSPHSVLKFVSFTND